MRYGRSKWRIVQVALVGGALLCLTRSSFAGDDHDARFIQVLRDLQDDDPQVILGALQSIKGEYSSRAEAAIPRLIELLKGDPQEADLLQVQKALAAIGRAAVPEVLKLLQAENAVWRERAATTLYLSLGSRDPDAVVPELAEAVRDFDPTVRYWSIRALGAIGPKSKHAVAAIAVALQDKEPEVRRAAGRTLASIGAGAEAAVPALIEQLKHSDITVRGTAVFALGRIGPNARSAAGELIPLLKHATLREEAAIALGRIGIVKHHAPSLIELLNHKDVRTRQLAALSLAHLGPDAGTAIEALVALLDDPQTVQFAIHALGRIGAEAKPAVPELIKLLQDDSYFIRAGAAEALGCIGPGARPALPALQAACDDKNELTRQHARLAVPKISSRPAD